MILLGSALHMIMYILFTQPYRLIENFFVIIFNPNLSLHGEYVFATVESASLK